MILSLTIPSFGGIFDKDLWCISHNSLQRNLHRPSLNYQVNRKSAQQRKGDGKRQIEQKVFYSQHDFKRAEVCDFRGRPRNHERGRASHTHAVLEPSLKQWDSAAPAHVQGNADGGGHQHAEASVAASKKTGEAFLRNIALKQGGKNNACEEKEGGGFYVPPEVF